MFPDYPAFPLRLVLEVGWALLTRRRRSLRQDALSCLPRLSLIVLSQEHIPQDGPALILMNHYHRPGFQAWWFALAISALMPVEVCWTVTNAWTDDGTPGARWRAWLSPCFLPRLAEVYGFVSMPPMPPRPHEVEARASAVRKLLSLARQNPPPVLAFAPEGQDSPNGGLMRPHPGVGRLISLLDGSGFSLYPVGIWEDKRALVLNFGAPFRLTPLPGLKPEERDARVSEQVMIAIARLLPPYLRGEFNLME